MNAPYRLQGQLFRRALLLITLLLPFTFAAATDGNSPLKVVVSISPYADLTARVAGERATVSTLLPPGASPHAFDPSPAQAAALAGADLVVMNGGVDSWAKRLVSAAAPNAALVELLTVIEFEPLAGHDHDHNHDEGDHHVHEAGERAFVNPHVWLDPTLAASAVRAIAAALAELDPAGEDDYLAAALQVSSELEDLDREVKELLSPVAGAPLVPFHDAWVYFAQRYELEIVVTLEPYAGREPSARYVAEAVRAVQASGAPVIFAEPQLGTRSAEVVAESAGVKIALLDPLGGTPGLTTYEELLLKNAEVIRAAFE